MIRYEKVPIEVIAKFNETGKCLPLKFIYKDDMFEIDKVMSERFAVPKELPTYSAQEYLCSIRGQEKRIYFDRTNLQWFVVKSVNVEQMFF